MTRFGRFAVLLTAASMATACASMPGPALADAVPVITGQHPQQSLEAGGYPYQLFVPRSYDSEAKWPLMIFLHGSGERGSDIAKVGIEYQVADVSHPIMGVAEANDKGHSVFF